MDLVACLSSGKGTCGHVNRLIQDQEWGNIYLITNEFGKENFHPEKKVNLIVVDSRFGLNDLRNEIEKQLKDKLNIEAALNIVSGTGKEHMAIIAALLKLGIGIRLIALTKEGIQEI